MRLNTRMVTAYVAAVVAVVLVLLLSPVLRLSLPLLAQVADSGATGAPSGNMDLGLAFLALKSIVLPLVATFLWKEWNLAKGWLSKLSNPLKAGGFVVFAALLGILATAVGQTIGVDPNTYTEGTFAGLVGGIVGAIEVMVGIKTAKTPKATPYPTDRAA